jgi:predicted DsbA family dithiol-disulfide isomerase
MFGSREAAKDEILSHWEHANQNDDLHRFNISGMRNADFLFPSSMKGLIACKAAYFAAGDAGYWDVFDALQNALFVQNRNIGNPDVIRDCIREANIDFGEWELHYNKDGTREGIIQAVYNVTEAKDGTNSFGHSCRWDGNKLSCD